MMICELLLLP